MVRQSGHGAFAWGLARQGMAVEVIRKGDSCMIYKFKSGSYIKADPQIAGEMCEKLASEGNLTARSLLNANRAEDAPLHKCFEWDDSVASELYRENQARHIINCICVVSSASTNKEPVRAYFNLVRQEQTYEHIETILQSENDTELLLKQALSELNAFQKKYKQLASLQPVFDAIVTVRNEELIDKAS